MALEGVGDVVGNFSGAFATSGTLLSYIIGFLVLFGFVWVILWFISFKYNVNIYERKGDNTIIISDRGKETKDRKNKEIKEFRLFKNKDGWRGPLSEEFFVARKKRFGIKYEINFFRNRQGKLIPMYPPLDIDREWEGLSGADLKWSQIAMRELRDHFTTLGFWDKYGQILLPFLAFAIIGVMGLVLFRQLEGVTEGLTSVAASLKNTATEAGKQTIIG